MTVISLVSKKSEDRYHEVGRNDELVAEFESAWGRVFIFYLNNRFILPALLSSMGHEQYMKEALKEAELALHEGNWPIGCVIVRDHAIIARNHSQSYTLQNRMAHAEMLALQQAQSLLYGRPKTAVLYTTYEPCPMCFGAAVLSRIETVVCGVDLDQSGAMYFRHHLPLLFKQDSFSINFITGILESECIQLFMQSEHAQRLLRAGVITRPRD